MIQEFSEDDIEPLATGAWILGTGGGGSPIYRRSTCAVFMPRAGG